MRYKDIQEHIKSMPPSWQAPIVDSSFKHEGNIDNFEIYSKSNSSQEIWIASNDDKETLGFVGLNKRNGTYFSVRNMMAYSKGAVRAIIKALLGEDYKLLSDDMMTIDGEKFFLSYANTGQLYSVNIATGDQKKWSTNMSGTNLDPRIDTKPKRSNGDKHDVYWLIEEYSAPSSKFGNITESTNTLVQKWHNKSIESKYGLDVEDY